MKTKNKWNEKSRQIERLERLFIYVLKFSGKDFHIESRENDIRVYFREFLKDNKYLIVAVQTLELMSDIAVNYRYVTDEYGIWNKG